MNPLLDSLITLLIPTLILLHLYYAPYTKVEESFNIQATHDIIFSGIPDPRSTPNVTQFWKDNYDHVSFPGSVPRTFVGALVLAGLSKPTIPYLTEPRQLQFVVRAILGLFNAFALIRFRDAVSTVFGHTAGVWYVLLQASQFHVIYYASRTLPNMFAFGMTTLAVRCLLLATTASEPQRLRRERLAIFLMTISGIIFRSEIAILLACHAVAIVISRRSVPWDLIARGLFSVFLGLFITVFIDSLFWQRVPLWPEWVGFYYNTILGKSADWGTSPFHWYFTSALPRLLLNPLTYLVLIPIAAFQRLGSLPNPALPILVPHLAFIAIYSLLSHKEWRFIVYTIPGLTGLAAQGATFIWTRRSKSLLYSLLTLTLVASVIASFFASTALLVIGSWNYPGGAALVRLHELTANYSTIDLPVGKKDIRVHLDNLACQTGVTRFLQNHDQGRGEPRWVYDKTENETTLLDPLFWQNFDFVLAERPEKTIGNWEVIDTIYGFAGISLVRPNEALEYQRQPFEKGEDVAKLVEQNGQLLVLWRAFEAMARKVTGGWWVRVKMEPKIRILRREDETGGASGAKRMSSGDHAWNLLQDGRIGGSG